MKSFDASVLPPSDMPDDELLTFQTVLDDGPGGEPVYMTAGEFREIHALAESMDMTFYELADAILGDKETRQ